MNNKYSAFILRKIKEIEEQRELVWQDMKKPEKERNYSDGTWHRLCGQIDILYIVLTAHDNKYIEQSKKK